MSGFAMELWAGPEPGAQPAPAERTPPRRRGRRIRAIHEAAEPIEGDRSRWLRAFTQSADAVNSPEARRRLRDRARYEVRNGSHAKALCRVMADNVVGTGPRLLMDLGDEAANQQVEDAWSEWALEADLSHKLWMARFGLGESGEIFGLMATNPRFVNRVKLDVRSIEPDQIAEPLGALGRIDPNHIDGIDLDQFGNPVRYHMLEQHPGDDPLLALPTDSRSIAAKHMLHLFRSERPGQHRGIPELSTVLIDLLDLREFTNAVIRAARNQANISGVFELESSGDGTDEFDPLDEIDLDSNMFLTTPAGSRYVQNKAEQPVTTYSEFVRSKLRHIAESMGVPYNLAFGDSSDMNFASGRLDILGFIKRVAADRQLIERLYLERIFRRWLTEAQLIEGYLPQAARMVEAAAKHSWIWPGLEPIDAAKEAQATQTRLASGTTTFRQVYAERGLDWRDELNQRAEEQRFMRELGLEFPTPAPKSNNRSEEPQEAENAND